MTKDLDPGTERTTAGTDRFGIVAAVGGVVLYVVAIVFFVLPLEHRLDTFLIASYLFLPAIVGGIVYDRITRAGGWR